MRIENYPFSIDFFKNLNNKKEEESTSKPKTEIQVMLEQRTKEIENTNLYYKKEKIARKIARGERITSEERELLAKHDPELLRKAEMAARRRKDLEMRLKRAKTEREAKAIIMEARVEVQMLSKDTAYANLLSDAYNKVDFSRKKKEENQ